MCRYLVFRHGSDKNIGLGHIAIRVIFQPLRAGVVALKTDTISTTAVKISTMIPNGIAGSYRTTEYFFRIEDLF